MLNDLYSKLVNLIFRNTYNLDIPVEIKNYRMLKILDVGSGYNPRLIADVMVNNVSIYAGKKTIKPKERFYTADIEDLPFKDNAFDIAISNHVFEHLRHPDVAFNEINRVAKKVLIVTPSALRETKGTDNDHFWFIYGLDGKYVFEAIPPNFKNDQELRKKYHEKFLRLNNELCIGDKSVYFKKSGAAQGVVEIIGVFDEKRYRLNRYEFREDSDSREKAALSIKYRINLFIKSLLRRYFLTTRRRLDPGEYLK